MFVSACARMFTFEFFPAVLSKIVDVLFFILFHTPIHSALEALNLSYKHFKIFYQCKDTRINLSFEQALVYIYIYI